MIDATRSNWQRECQILKFNQQILRTEIKEYQVLGYKCLNQKGRNFEAAEARESIPDDESSSGVSVPNPPYLDLSSG